MTFLILGGGAIGRRHISNLLKIGYTSIFCLKRHPDEAFEQEHKVKVITSLQELEGTKIDAVIVCTPTSMHIEGMAIALKLSASVFMEKPLIHSKEGMEEAIKLASDNDKIFFIGFMLRYHPLVIRLKELLDARILGNVYSARFEFGSYLPYWHPWEDHRTSYASRVVLGGGVINTITHELDLIQYFFGMPSTVYTTSVNLSKLDIETEELAEAILEYPDKVVTLHLDYLQKDYDRNIRILCDDGKLIWNWHENKIHILRHKGQPEVVQLQDEFNVNDLYIHELQDFIRIEQEKILVHSLDFNHAVTNTKLMLSMHESGKQGKKIAV